ncbi:MAG: SLBB domain-containing protein, partial [Actinomycetota bacterium]|nr:SLBB domain-containing protein [Actinomycetota bacterium]
VSVCRDLACAMRGGAALTERIEAWAAECGGDVDVHRVSCLGRCDRAPACLFGDEPASHAEVEAGLRMEPGALDAFAPSEPSTRVDAGFASDPYPDADAHYGALRDRVASGDWPWLIDRVEASGLRGMGGAGFPTGAKWRMVAGQSQTPKIAVCNADESEPGTFKDREILARLPHLAVEGLALGGLCVGAERGIFFVRHEYGPETRRLREEIERARQLGALGCDVFGSGRAFDVEVFVSPGGYVLGEETALLECLEGRRGEPRNKPPFPGESGLRGLPTLINNVETLCAVPRIARGADADLKFFSVSGDVASPGVHEVPLGTTLSDLVERCGGMRDGRPLLAFLPGGASTGFLGAEHAHIPLDWQSLREAGSALGSGAVVVVAEGADLRLLAGNLTAFFRNESCGKCVPCRIGTERAVKLIEASGPLDVEGLSALADLLADTSICGLGQAALIPITSVIDGFGAQGEDS